MPLKVGAHFLNNRIAMAPVTTGFENRGYIDTNQIEFYRKRVRDNGAGLVIVRNGIISLTGKKKFSDTTITPSYLATAHSLTKALHQEGAKAILQLQHYGAEAEHPFAIAASRTKNKDTGHTVNRVPKFAIDHLIQHYATAALESIQQGGFDGIEINAGHLTLPNTFTSPILNRRNDSWGIQRKHNFAIELVRRVRGHIGPSPILAYRISLLDLYASGTPWIDVLALAQNLHNEGVNLFSFDIGLSSNAFPVDCELTPEGVWTTFMEKFTSEIKVPVIFGGNLSNPQRIEDLLRTNITCMVEIGKPLLADPNWTQKIRNNQASIIPFVGHDFNRPVDENSLYSIARPTANIIKKNEALKKVLVVGAGPAGIAAAREAALLGREVTLIDKKENLGGLFRLGGKIPGRQNILRLIEAWKKELERLGVEIRLGINVSGHMIEDEYPNHTVFIAVGRESTLPNLPGVDNPNVLTVEDLLEKQMPVGHRVAVIGSGSLAIDVARFLSAPSLEDPDEWFKAWGIGDPAEHRGGVLGVIPYLTTPTRHTDLINLNSKGSFEQDLTELNRFYELQWLRMHGVNTFEQVAIEQIDIHSLKIRSNNDHEGSFTLRTDHVVVADKFEPREELTDELNELDKEYVLAGSCDQSWNDYSASRAILDAVLTVRKTLS